MDKNDHCGPFSSIARTVYLLIQGRLHFPQDCLGETVNEENEFEIFRQMMLDPGEGQPETAGAIFTVRFRFASMSAAMNKRTSWIPVPFIVAQPGFRSKTWALSRKTGEFQGVYEWDTVAAAETYWTSFPMNLMKSRAVPESLCYEIESTTAGRVSQPARAAQA